MARQRVLFVDDDPDILTALQRAFRRDRSRWDVAFANGPDAALRELVAAQFDVIVSDLTMPGMSGDRLLQGVSELYPWMSRILLSGSIDSQRIPFAEHVLSKPYDLQDLRLLLERLDSKREAEALHAGA